MEQRVELIGYWRSSAAYRVRIALNLKGISYEQSSRNLQAAEHRETAYLRLNPQGLVPTLRLDDDRELNQSLAIIEWLDEVHPDPPLLPAKVWDRACARAAAQEIACDIHPLNNLRVLTYLRSTLGRPEADVDAWVRHWVAAGLDGLEARFATIGDDYFFGPDPGIVEICLVPQLYSARRFGVDLTRYPRLLRAEQAALQLAAFQRAAPERQPDAPAT